MAMKYRFQVRGIRQCFCAIKNHKGSGQPISIELPLAPYATINRNTHTSGRSDVSSQHRCFWNVYIDRCYDSFYLNAKSLLR